MSNFTPEDTALVQAAIQGDKSALNQVLMKSEKYLKRFARRSCATAEDAEDAVQVALWRLYRKIGTLRAAHAISAWLFRIVERECRRLFRIQRNTVPLEDSLLNEVAAVEPPHHLIRDAAYGIHALPPLYREVLILRDVEGMSAYETAALLEISVEAVKSRLHRARGLLRERMALQGYIVKA